MRYTITDFYYCKIQFNENNIVSIVTEIISNIKEKQIFINYFSDKKKDVHLFTSTDDLHISLHTKIEINFISLIIYLPANNLNSKLLIRLFRKEFKAESIKIINLNTADFDTIRNIRPKTQIKTNSIRKVKNVSNKVINYIKLK